MCRRRLLPARINELEDQISAAVAAEDYLEAAKLKEQLKAAQAKQDTTAAQVLASAVEFCVSDCPAGAQTGGGDQDSGCSGGLLGSGQSEETPPAIAPSSSQQHNHNHSNNSCGGSGGWRVLGVLESIGEYWSSRILESN